MPSQKGFIGLKLLESDREIKKLIHEGMAEHINAVIKKNKQQDRNKEFHTIRNLNVLI